MRFVCDQCKAKYSISDEKVRGKILKIRCKRCQNIIEIRDPSSKPSVTASKPPASAPRSPKPSAGPARSAAAQPTSSAHGPPGAGSERFDDDYDPDERDERTQISAPGLLDELRRTAAHLATQPGDEPDLVEWFVAIEDEPVGPITRERVRSLVATGKVNGENLCWREGYDDWIPLRESRELAGLLAVARPAAHVAAPPPAALRSTPPPPAAFSSTPPPPPADALRKPVQRAAPLVGAGTSPLRGQNIGRLGAAPRPVQEPAPAPAPAPAPFLQPLRSPAASPPVADPFARFAAPVQPVQAPRLEPRPEPSVGPPIAEEDELEASLAALVAVPAQPPAPKTQTPIPAPMVAPFEAAPPPAPPVEAAAPPSESKPTIPQPPPKKSEPPGSDVGGDSSLKALAKEMGEGSVHPPPPRDSRDPSPSIMMAARQTTKSRRQMAIVLAGIAAILIGVGVTIAMIKMGGNQSEAATQREPRVARSEPLEPANLNPGSLEIPLGGGSNEDAGTPDAELEEEFEVDPNAVMVFGVGNGARPNNGDNNSSNNKGRTLSDEERAALAKAAELGTDNSSPVIGNKGSNGNGEVVKRGQPLSSEEIRSTIGKNRSTIVRCYEREMRGRGAGGSDLRVVVRLTVRPSGLVSAASVSPANIRGTGLGKCIEGAVKRWRFPIASADSTVEAPFLLTPGRGQ